jgi:DNA-directed RNA polymerase subunit RPC12/RpoP
MRDMDELVCSRCDQRYYTSARLRRRGNRCPLCGGRIADAPAVRGRRRRPALPLEPTSRVAHRGARGLPDVPPSAEPGTYPEDGATYASVLDFAWADRRRLPSRERDVGLRWRAAEAGSPWRAAWVEDTGELYVVQSGEPATGGGHVEVLGVARELPDLAAALAGWEDVCGEPDSLDWLRARCAERLPPPAS